jgi:hypothetical protein
MKYFFGFLITIGLVIIVFIMIVKGFSGDSKKVVPTPLSSYAGTSTVVRFTVSGPIVGDDQFNSYQITVGREQTAFETRQGYEAQPINQRTYENNQEAYVNFLRALDFAGFTRGDKKASKDERGTCANGRRYVMEIRSGESDKQRFWATTCRGQGSFGGNVEEVRRLFNAQIPAIDFSKLTNGLKL